VQKKKLWERTGRSLGQQACGGDVGRKKRMGENMGKGCQKPERSALKGMMKGSVIWGREGGGHRSEELAVKGGRAFICKWDG